METVSMATPSLGRLSMATPSAPGFEPDIARRQRLHVAKKSLPPEFILVGDGLPSEHSFSQRAIKLRSHRRACEIAQGTELVVRFPPQRFQCPTGQFSCLDKPDRAWIKPEIAVRRFAHPLHIFHHRRPHVASQIEGHTVDARRIPRHQQYLCYVI